MRSGVPVQDLRGSDSTLLEVQVPDLWKLPLGQVHLLNVLDLFELHSTEGCPRSLKGGLQTFNDRTLREIRDLPFGASWDAFVGELAEVDAGRIPAVVRDLLAAEAERRDHSATRELLSALEGRDPESFEIGVRKAKVQRAEAVTPKKKRSLEPSSAPSEGRSRKSESSSSSSRSSASASSNANRVGGPILDIDRHKFLQQIALERLAGTSEKGLMEAVLVAGIRHLAKDEYNDVTPKQIKDALKGLKDDGRVRYSAGRWMSPSRY